MAISLSSLTKTTGKPYPLVLIYGPEKVGKTTLASEFPAPVLIQTAGENTPEGVTVDSFGHLEDFDGLMGACEALFNEEHSFKTLIVDAIDGVERIVWAEACKRNNWSSLEEPGYGKGYVEADRVWGEFFAALRGLNDAKGMIVVLIGHVEIKPFEDPASGTYSRFQPNLHKRAGDVVKASMDIIAFVNQRTSLVKEKAAFGETKTRAEGVGQRVIYLEARPGFIAGNRYKMPDTITYKEGKGFAEIAKHLPKVAA